MERKVTGKKCMILYAGKAKEERIGRTGIKVSGSAAAGHQRILPDRQATERLVLGDLNGMSMVQQSKALIPCSTRPQRPCTWDLIPNPQHSC